MVKNYALLNTTIKTLFILSCFFLAAGRTAQAQQRYAKLYGNSGGNQQWKPANTIDGYYNELWKNIPNGEIEMTLKENEGAAFSCEWDYYGANGSAVNLIARRGHRWNETQTHSQLGQISADFGCDFQPQGNTYLCIYGWAKGDPDNDIPGVEFYIVENHHDSYNQSIGHENDRVGGFSSDGGWYDIYKIEKEGQASIWADSDDFTQYISIRRDVGNSSRRNDGQIDVSAHFNKWDELGMEMGNMSDLSLTIEAYESTGEADFYRASITVGGGGEGQNGGQNGGGGGGGGQSGGNEIYSAFKPAANLGNCLSIDGGFTHPGAKMIQRGCDNQSDQVWKLIQKPDYSYQIVNTKSNHCLALDNGSTTNGTKVMQWNCNENDTNQKWWIIPHGGQYEVKNDGAQKCIDVPGGTGTIMQIYDCWNSNNQRFEIAGLGGARKGEVNPIISGPMKAAPNPTDGDITFSNVAPGSTIVIVNAMSKVVTSVKVDQESKASVDMSGLPAGIYNAISHNGSITFGKN